MDQSNLPTPLTLETQSRLDAIDLLKFIFSIFVVTTHTTPLKGISPFVAFLSTQSVTRMANSIFFICSGFFYARRAMRDGWTPRTLLVAIRRIAILYLAWTVIYLPLIIQPEKIFQWTLWARLIYKTLFTGSFFHFWYFPALISSIALYHVLQNRFRFPAILCIGLVFYLFCLLGNSYWQVGRLPAIKPLVNAWNSAFLNTRNLFMSGFIFVDLGAQAAKTPFSPKLQTTALLAFVFILLMMAESHLLKINHIAKSYHCFVFMIPAVFFLFQSALKWNLTLKMDSTLLRNLSIVNYCSHALFYRIGNSYEYLAHHRPLLFILVLACSLGTGWLIINSKNKLLRLLY